MLGQSVEFLTGQRVWGRLTFLHRMSEPMVGAQALSRANGVLPSRGVLGLIAARLCACTRKTEERSKADA